ncbi:MAG TPA: DUF1080 domain-containing protein [Lacunisphaera sp.]|jgi:hypothetical protein|nr:DUF1080 domain-containing protein [Lacunisphaera sp.]
MRILYPALGLAGALLLPAAVAADPTALFNGRDLAGWEFVAIPAKDIAAVCQVHPDGVLAAQGKPVGYLAATDRYENFRLHAEWRWPEKPGNGGILVHISSGPKDRAWPVCLQIQLKHGAAGDLLPMAGATFAEPLAADQKTPQRLHQAADSEHPAGEWNTCDITCRNDTLEVSINGVVQNRVTHVSPAAGRIGFQFEGTPFEVRHISLVRLD